MEVTTTHTIVGEYRVTADWRGDHIGPIRLEITLAEGARHGVGITRTGVRSLTLGELQAPETPEEGNLDTLAEWVKVRACRRRGGGRSAAYSEKFYATVALMYRLGIDEGAPDPAYLVANLTGVQLRTAQSWIAKARRRGLLTSTTTGRNGGLSHGRLTDRAREALAS